MKMATKLWEIGQCGRGLRENGFNFYAVIKSATKIIVFASLIVLNPGIIA